MAFESESNQKIKEFRAEHTSESENLRDREISPASSDSRDSSSAASVVLRNHSVGNQATLRRLSRHSGPSAERMPVPQGIQEELQSAGQPLDSATRTFMEPRFGQDFGNVRVHTGDKAEETASAINARAYTYGQDIVFNAGEYSPGTTEGRKTLAHELAHTLQQSNGVSNISNLSETTASHDRSELEAEAAAESVMSGTELTMENASGKEVARQPPDAGTPLPPDAGVPAGPDAGVPVAPAKKTVTVNITNMFGTTRSASSDITVANTIYSAANIEIKKGNEVTIDEKKSKTILGSDLTLDEYTDPAKPTTEEKAMLKENQTKDAITVYYVKKHTFSGGEAFWPSGGSGLIGCSLTNATIDNSFAHELGHVLLDSGAHSVPDKTYLMWGVDDAARKKLTPDQITKAQSSKFAK